MIEWNWKLQKMKKIYFLEKNCPNVSSDKLWKFVVFYFSKKSQQIAAKCHLLCFLHSALLLSCKATLSDNLSWSFQGSAFLWIILLFISRVCHAFLPVHCSTCWERADFLARLYVSFSCVLSASHVVSLVRYGTWLYRSLIFSFLLNLKTNVGLFEWLLKTGFTVHVLNKSENASHELSAIYIQNYTNQICKWKCILMFKYWVMHNSKGFMDVVTRKPIKAI